MRPKGTVNTNKGPKPPTRPKPRSLATSAQHRVIIPYLIEGDEKLGITHEDNIYVALGKLRYRSYENYEIVYNESIDIAVSRIMWILAETNRIAGIVQDLMGKLEKKEITDEEFKKEAGEVPTITHDDAGRIKTPHGPMWGSLERNMVDLATYILAQHGRIVGDNGDGTYEYESITPDEIRDMLEDPATIFGVTEDGNSLFFEILETSGVWNSKKVAEDLADNAEIDDEELKN